MTQLPEDLVPRKKKKEEKRPKRTSLRAEPDDSPTPQYTCKIINPKLKIEVMSRKSSRAESSQCLLVGLYHYYLPVIPFFPFPMRDFIVDFFLYGLVCVCVCAEVR